MLAKIFNKIKSAFQYRYQRILKVKMYLFKSSDLERWSNESNLFTDWDERTKIISTLIPENVTVLEFGAGRLVLKQLLHPSCNYQPSDIVDRGFGTIVCDLNNDDLPGFSAYDYIVFSGVLEYIYDLDRLFRHLEPICENMILSYATTDFTSNRNINIRRSYGWVSDYSKIELLLILKKYSFKLERELVWRDQTIFKLVKVKE